MLYKRYRTSFADTEIFPPRCALLTARRTVSRTDRPPRTCRSRSFPWAAPRIHGRPRARLYVLCCVRSENLDRSADASGRRRYNRFDQRIVVVRDIFVLPAHVGHLCPLRCFTGLKCKGAETRDVERVGRHIRSGRLDRRIHVGTCAPRILIWREPIRGQGIPSCAAVSQTIRRGACCAEPAEGSSLP